MRKPIYLDYAATTPVDPRVADVMNRYFTLEDGGFGNPASLVHTYGWRAHEAVENARHQVAALLNTDPAAIVWTSGATESNNLALKGVCGARSGKRHVVTCATEHSSVLDSCRWLEREGVHITYLTPRPDGLLDVSQVLDAVRDDTVLVSLMHVNNEIGVVQDIDAIGKALRDRECLFHVDAAQSLGKVPVDLQRLDVDLMSFSGHKIYGPKGVGALYVRRDPRVSLVSQIHGGGHEGGLRSGTLATHQIAGFGQACAIAAAEMAEECGRIAALRDRLWRGLGRLPEVRVNGSLKYRVCGNLNVSFGYVEGETLMMALKDLAVSSSSACSSTRLEPSHVLRAIGVPDELAFSAIRFTLGRYSTEEEVDFAVDLITRQVTKLRELSPLWMARGAG